MVVSRLTRRSVVFFCLVLVGTLFTYKLITPLQGVDAVGAARYVGQKLSKEGVDEDPSSYVSPQIEITLQGTAEADKSVDNDHDHQGHDGTTTKIDSDRGDESVSNDDRLSEGNPNEDDVDSNNAEAIDFVRNDAVWNELESGDYREIFSVSSRDRKFYGIWLDGEAGYNTNVIPHPTNHDLWIVVVQHERYFEETTTSEQFACTAGFLNGVLACTETPVVIPTEPSIDGVCENDLAYLNFGRGPHDARMFYGPNAPFIMYNSQSQYACFGLWLEDARMLLDAFKIERETLTQSFFKTATELRRPEPWKAIEKNFFLFWDSQGIAYTHYDLFPKRTFAQLNFDGSGLGDLASQSADKDQICMAKFMPSLGPRNEDIHQATNSLSITLCSRSDPSCVPNDSNTLIMHIFHHKHYYDFHARYDPYVILFQRHAPFAIHAISQRPLWIHGRNALTAASDSIFYRGKPENIPPGHTEFFYMTSMSWKSHDQKYHGYIDDVIFLSFGIEDSRPGTIDVLAGDLLQDLAFCDA